MLKTLPHSSTDIQYLASTMMEREAKLLTYPPESHGEIFNLNQWMHLPAHREDQKICYASELCNSNKATNQLHITG
jgi:hypothetical protein